jgi:hypothetical protein
MSSTFIEAVDMGVAPGQHDPQFSPRATLAAGEIDEVKQLWRFAGSAKMQQRSNR